MKKNNFVKIFSWVLASFVFAPLFFAFAGSGDGAVNYTIENPLGSSEVKVILVSIMNLVATVGSMVVVFFIILSGYKFVTAGSSDTDRTKAKEMFYATIIGGAILLGADVIANVVVNTVKTTVGAK